MRRGAGNCSSYAGWGRDADDTARAEAVRFSSRIARSRSVARDRGCITSSSSAPHASGSRACRGVPERERID